MAFQRSHMRMTHSDTDDKKVNMAVENPVIQADSGPDTNQKVCK